MTDTKTQGGRENTHEDFLIYATYDEQVQGIIKVPARDEEHAKEQVTKAYSKALNFEIINIVREKDVKKTDEPEHDLFEPKLNEKKVLN